MNDTKCLLKGELNFDKKWINFVMDRQTDELLTESATRSGSAKT